MKRIHDKWMYEQWQAYEREIAQEGDTQKVMVDKGKDKPRTLGHVTRDKCPGTGDDIAHIPGMSQPQIVELSELFTEARVLSSILP